MTDQTTGRWRWLLGALIGSLALNLLLVGFLLGAKLRNEPPAGAMLHNSAFSVGRALRQFEEPRRSTLWKLTRPHFSGLRKEIRALRDAQRDWERAYTADPIDLDALDASYNDLTVQVQRIQQMNFAAIRSLAEELTDRERAELLIALRSRGHRHPRADEKSLRGQGAVPDS